jgi:hypothetical protein
MIYSRPLMSYSRPLWAIPALCELFPPSLNELFPPELLKKKKKLTTFYVSAHSGSDPNYKTKMSLRLKSCFSRCDTINNDMVCLLGDNPLQLEGEPPQHRAPASGRLRGEEQSAHHGHWTTKMEPPESDGGRASLHSRQISFTYILTNNFV